MTDRTISRRKFIGRVAASSAAFAVVPRHVLGGAGFQAPSDTLNVAAIGAGGMGASNMSRLTSENIVAIADVDFDRVAGSLRGRDGNVRPERQPLADAYEKAKRYTDFREMLDRHDDIDAVVIATPDHFHATAASTAMQMGKHVYVQKPLTWSVYEARRLRELADETGVVTQMGNQGHSGDDGRRLVEWVWADAIGPVNEVHIWTNRPIWPQGVPRPEPMDVPSGFDWDTYLGPVHYLPFADVYHPFAWRGWVEFGVGALGDMGAHLLDHSYWALGLDRPSRVWSTSTPFGEDGEGHQASWPLATTVYYEFGRGGRQPVKMAWYDGGLLPPRPDPLPDDVELNRGGGAILVGEKGILMHDTYGNNPRLFPQELEQEYADAPQVLPRIETSHEMNWANAAKGLNEPSSPFEYAAPLTETMVLGLVALRAGKPIVYDADNMRIPNAPEAEQYLHREYRDGWTL